MLRGRERYGVLLVMGTAVFSLSVVRISDLQQYEVLSKTLFRSTSFTLWFLGIGITKHALSSLHI